VVPPAPGHVEEVACVQVHGAPRDPGGREAREASQVRRFGVHLGGVVLEPVRRDGVAVRLMGRRDEQDALGTLDLRKMGPFPHARLKTIGTWLDAQRRKAG